MRKTLIKAAIVAATLLGLGLIVGEIPGASLPVFVALKGAGLGLFYISARAFERVYPNEEV